MSSNRISFLSSRIKTVNSFVYRPQTPYILVFTRNPNPYLKVYRFQLILIKLSNLLIVWAAGKNFTLSNTPSQNTPAEKFTRKPRNENTNKCNKLRFTPASNHKIGPFVITPIFTVQKRISNKLQAIRKRP